MRNVENDLDKVETVEELINTVLEIGGDKISVAFSQPDITKINETYSVPFFVVLRDSLPSKFGEIDPGRLPLTDEEEYTVNPSFEFTTAHPDTIYGDAKVCEATRDIDKPHADLGLLKTLLGEVDLSEEQFIDFVEQGEGLNQVVQHVEVGSSQPSQVGVEATGSTKPMDNGFHFFITLRTQAGHRVDGIHPDHRFDHVATVTLSGHQYPTTIETTAFNDWENTTQGQWIHTSDFLVNNTEVPKIQLSNEIKRIDWGEFFSNDQPRPESQGYSPRP